MLLEIMHPITIDKRVICNSFRLNVVSAARQMRCKIEFPDQSSKASKPYLVDLVIYKYSDFKIDGLGASISFDGEELETKTSFDAKIVYDIMKRSCKFKGKLGKKDFSFNCSTVLEVIEKIGELINPLAGNSRITITPKNIRR